MHGHSMYKRLEAFSVTSGLGERFQRHSATRTMYPSLSSDFQRLHLGLGTLSINRRVLVLFFSFLINLKIFAWPFGPFTGRVMDL